MFYTIQKYQPSGWKSCAKVFNNTEKFDDVGEGPVTKYTYTNLAEEIEHMRKTASPQIRARISWGFPKEMAPTQKIFTIGISDFRTY